MKPYILRQWPEQIDTTTPVNLERLKQFIDASLSIGGQMYTAANAPIYGKHGKESHAEDQSGE